MNSIENKIANLLQKTILLLCFYLQFSSCPNALVLCLLLQTYYELTHKSRIYSFRMNTGVSKILLNDMKIKCKCCTFELNIEIQTEVMEGRSL